VDYVYRRRASGHNLLIMSSFGKITGYVLIKTGLFIKLLPHTRQHVDVCVATTFFFFFFCRAQWLMPPDVPQPVRLIVLTLL
jgi:hypothetical protein